MAFSSKLSTEERLLRKRQAARIRQQRCRARKRQSLLERQKKGKETERATVSVGGSETGITRSTENMACKVSPRYPAEHSPRSVFWNDVPHSPWVMPPPGAIDFPHRHPVFDSKRRRCWPYEHGHMVGSHYDAPTKDHGSMYCRYQQSPPLSHPQVRPYPRSLPQKFVPINAPVSRYYAYPDRELELNRPPAESEISRPSWVPPKLPLLKKTDAEPIESKEEAAIDAILALKAGEVIVPPPKIQRVSAEPNSAFQEYRHGLIPRPTLPGFYLTMRN